MVSDLPVISVSSLMPRSKQKGSGRARCAPSPNKQLLLPLPAAHVKHISLIAHLALAACRSGKGNRHQLYELVRATYLSYFLWKDGYGSADHELYCAAERKLEEAAERAHNTGEWRIEGEAASLLEVVLQIFDSQIGSVSGKSYLRNRGRLERLLHRAIPQRTREDGPAGPRVGAPKMSARQTAVT